MATPKGSELNKIICWNLGTNVCYVPDEEKTYPIAVVSCPPKSTIVGFKGESFNYEGNKYVANVGIYCGSTINTPSFSSTGSISLTNSSSVVIPAGFQQKIVLNTRGLGINDAYSNVIFNCPSYLESIQGLNSELGCFYLRIPTAVEPNEQFQVQYYVFPSASNMQNGTTAGQNSMLPAVTGPDNGSQVFFFYSNFCVESLQSTALPRKVEGNCPVGIKTDYLESPVGYCLEIVNKECPNVSNVVLFPGANLSLSNEPLLVEISWVYENSSEPEAGDCAAIGLFSDTSETFSGYGSYAPSNSSGLAIYSQFKPGTYPAIQYNDSLNYSTTPLSKASYGSCYTYTQIKLTDSTVAVFTAQNSSQAYTANPPENDLLKVISSQVSISSEPPTGLWIGSSNGSLQSSQIFFWVRARSGLPQMTQE
ncbi:uncharacterized protein Gasu_21260 [Galdieria sulphuraria]|uniref:Uncharacterized protein n=1 Tax=Galdieria sulphuraria TaxID=130081 RepID=M2Y4A7_GALSU|nr:uncharacterized protein Gasu_21260 [Galdieria sulphuraria]EME30669.1 hypothetical protein Gasu_21260 [Galdieria sulphuraria]|eukprot:XP_005707189.1 hypothetical protein Gasu_21260 [Galdieria sulphuraria]